MNRICGIGRLLGGRARLLGIQELLLTDLKLTNMLELNLVYQKNKRHTSRSRSYYRVFDAPGPPPFWQFFTSICWQNLMHFNDK